MKNKFKKWILRKFREHELADIVKYGVDGGFSGLIYYSETTVLYKKFHDEIWDLLCEDAENCGLNVLQLIGSFRIANTVNDHAQFANLLVWYAVERIALQVIEDRHTDEDEKGVS